jgi:hypothetical protein
MPTKDQAGEFLRQKRYTVRVEAGEKKGQAQNKVVSMIMPKRIQAAEGGGN